MVLKVNRTAFFIVLVMIFFIVGSSWLSADDDRVDFRNDVMPVLTKHGCNAGSCHGAAVGRGGLRLSLYGGRPEDDYLAITRESKGRRVNRFDVGKSLVLRKPGGDMEHGGHQRFDMDDASARVLMQWIKQGAVLDEPGQQGPVTLAELEIGDRVVRYDKVGAVHPFKFFARFSDGTRRDVTEWTVLKSDDESSVSVDEASNVATIHRRGRHVLVARYLNSVQSIEIMVPFGQPESEIDWERGQNRIDDRIYEKLNQLGLPATSVVGDAGFIRRVSLDLTGRLPLPDEVDSFVGDSGTDKRSELIGRLMMRESFNDYWAYRFSNLLRIRSQPQDSKGARTYYRWLREQISKNEPWDRIVRKLLLSNGDSHAVGPANFFRTTNDARLQTEFVAESLMGVTLRCANCHNHPFDSWTQDDYHGLAAVFAKTKQGRNVTAYPQGENIHPLTSRPAIPRIPSHADLFDRSLELDRETFDFREPFANWLLDDENPFFARAIVNRIWKDLLGRGLVADVNDLRTTSPASHPELLQWLADDFVDHDFDLRHTIARICGSAAYQRERRGLGSTTDGDATQDGLFYGFGPPRPLAPEVLSDAICDITGVPEVFGGEPDGTRAVQLFDSKIRSRALDVLGRCSRDESCDTSAELPGGGLSTQLHLLNGDLINQKITSSRGRLAKMIAMDKSSKEIVRQFYLLGYGRPPTRAEAGFWSEKIEEGEVGESVRQQRLEDFVWSLLNSQEFLTNH